MLATAQAADPDKLTVGVLHREDVHVVQKVLYPKVGRSEINVNVGLMAFDPNLTTPNAGLSFEMHQSEQLSVGAWLGGGYGLKNKVTVQLESPAFGVAPYAYRYLASALGGITWSPIYGKMSLGGAKVLHYDVYLAGRGGITLEQSVIPGGGMPVGPTLSPGLGMRIFTGDKMAVRTEFRDDLVLQKRKLTSNWALKQNANVTIGLSFLSPVKNNR
jgi:outer membrane beta-barrel protein